MFFKKPQNRESRKRIAKRLDKVESGERKRMKNGERKPRHDVMPASCNTQRPGSH